MEDMEEEERGEKARGKWNKSGTAGLRSFLNEDALGKKSGDKDEEQPGAGTKPIADLFPETTIMFAVCVLSRVTRKLCHGLSEHSSNTFSLRILLALQHGLLPENPPKCLLSWKVYTMNLM